MNKLKLHHQIFLAMLLGAILGIAVNQLTSSEILSETTKTEVSNAAKEIGGLFLRLLQMVVVPLIVSSLVSSISNLGNLKNLRTLGKNAIGFYLTTSALAIFTGILWFNILSPGKNTNLGFLKQMDAPKSALLASEPKSVSTILWDQIKHMVPKNPLAAATEGDMLPLIFFSILLGIFISKTSQNKNASNQTLISFFDQLFEVMMRMTMFVIHLAPIGVFGFMLHATASQGLSVFLSLGGYMLTVFLALLTHALITLPLFTKFLAKRSPKEFAKQMSPALLTAFSTASSNGTLPLTLDCTQNRANIDKQVSSFVLPLGATINMDGTALYEAVAVLFIAQATGADLSIAQQLLVAWTALLVSVGAAGIPHAGTIMMVVVLSAVGLPTESVGIILAVDRVLDMCRTTVNVWSDSVASAFVHQKLTQNTNVR